MNISRSSAVKAASVLALAVFAGCGGGDGTKQLEKGMAALEACDYARADRYFAQCLKLSPGNVDALVAETRVKLIVGDTKEAGRLIARAAELAAEDADVISLVAEVAWHARDFDEASRNYLRLAQDERFDEATRSLGWTGYGVVENARERGDLSCHLARCAFLRAIRLNRKNAAAWYHLGLLYRDGFGFVDAALEQFQFYVRLAETADARVQRVQDVVIGQLREQISQRLASVRGAAGRNSAAAAAALSRAETAAKNKQQKTAKQFYAEAYSADPLSFPAVLGLARCWEKDTTAAGQKEALRHYHAACELNPSALQVYLTAGALAAKLGRDAGAADYYSRAVAANPANLTALDGLIRALRKTGVGREAADVYQRYRDSLPTRRAQ